MKYIGLMSRLQYPAGGAAARFDVWSYPSVSDLGRFKLPACVLELPDLFVSILGFIGKHVLLPCRSHARDPSWSVWHCQTCRHVGPRIIDVLEAMSMLRCTCKFLCRAVQVRRQEMYGWMCIVTSQVE